MTADDVYKAILTSITKVRDARAERLTGLASLEGPLATDDVLDEMARNAAQNIALMLDEPDEPASMQPERTWPGKNGPTDRDWTKGDPYDD